MQRAIVVLAFVVLSAGLMAQQVIDVPADPESAPPNGSQTVVVPPLAAEETPSPPAATRGENGRDGVAGQNGQNGRNGRNGRPGQTGPPGKDAQLPKDWLRQSPQAWSGDSTQSLEGDGTGLHAGRSATREEMAASNQRGDAKTEKAANAYTDCQVATERDQRIAANAKKRKDGEKMTEGIVGGVIGLLSGLLIACLLRQQIVGLFQLVAPTRSTQAPTDENEGSEAAQDAQEILDAMGLDADDPNLEFVGRHSTMFRNNNGRRQRTSFKFRRRVRGQPVGDLPLESAKPTKAPTTDDSPPEDKPAEPEKKKQEPEPAAGTPKT